MIDDKYTYPGSGGVLINRFGIRDAAQLDEAMNDFASARAASLREEPLPDRFDFAYLQHIHTRLFDPLLQWAGQVRDVDVQAVGTGITYCRPEYIADQLHDAYRQLDRDHQLRDLDPDHFAAKLADHWGNLTAIHPFRDGNTRSQTVYVDALARSAGYSINWPANVDQLRTARLHAVAARTAPLADMIRKNITPIGTFEHQNLSGRSPLAAREARRESGLVRGNVSPRENIARAIRGRAAQQYGKPAAPPQSNPPGRDHGLD